MVSTLYKYVVPARIDILLQKKIRFTQPCFLNDPFEFNPGRAEGPMGHFETHIGNVYEASYREKSRAYGILSLTKKRDSIPMWTHYADSHRGFVIGFDTQSEWLQQAGSALREVQYQKQRACLTRHRSPGESNEDIFYWKSTQWAYEEEWRWVESRDPSEYAELIGGPSGELFFLRSILPNSIRQIVLGYRASSSLRESIQALKAVQDYQHLEIFQADLHGSDYRLEIREL